MKTSATISAIAADLVKALGEIKAIKKDAKNPFLKNKYASIDAIIEGTKGALKAHNLCVFQSVTDGVETTILHTSGEWISSDIMTIPAEQSKGLSMAQARGVAITYCKRYQLGSILGISTDEDTDGSYDEHSVNEPATPAPKSEKNPIPAERYAAMIEVLTKKSYDEAHRIVTEAAKRFTFTADQAQYIESVIKSKTEKP